MVVLQTVSPPSEGVKHEQAEITAVLDGKGLGSGTLCVAESRVSWFDGSGLGFSLDYPSISLHAISRDLSAYPEEHLYVMVNSKQTNDSKIEEQKAKGKGDGSGGDDEEDNDDDDDDEEDDEDDDSDAEDSISLVTEIRFVPSDKGSLETMFSAMSECQALHPDPDDSDSDFDGDEYDVEEAEQGQIDLPTYYSFEEGMSQLTVEGQATLERLEGMLAQSSAPQRCMAGVRTEDTAVGVNDESKTNSALGVSGQFDDADVDHW